MCTNVLGCIMVAAGLVAGVICIVGLAIPFWAVGNQDLPGTMPVKEIIYEGLWEKCTVTAVRDDWLNCEVMWSADVTDHTSGKKAVLAMCLIGLIGITAFSVVMVLHLTLCSTVESLTKVAAGLALIAGGFILIGIIVYASDGKNDTVDGSRLSAGFGLCLASAILCFILGGLAFFVE